MTIFFRQAERSDAAAISGLVGDLAHYFLADPSSPDGEPFLATITPDAFSERIAAPNYLHILAEDSIGVCGIVAMRDRSHLYHLFVRSELHNQGIARALWKRAKSVSEGSRFTVNSSLFAVPVYMRLGFSQVGPAQTKNGVAFQPMVYPAGA